MEEIESKDLQSQKAKKNIEEDEYRNTVLLEVDGEANKNLPVPYLLFAFIIFAILVGVWKMVSYDESAVRAQYQEKMQIIKDFQAESNNGRGL